MMKKILAFALVFGLLFSFAACGGDSDSGAETTVSGMVVSVEGTVIQLMDSSSMGGRGQGGNRGQNGNRGENGEGNSQRPSMPEGWNSEDFTLPEGATMPEGFENFNPENWNSQDFTMPEGWEGFNPENFQGGERPEGETRPEGEGQGRPQGGFGGNFNMEGVETTSYDVANARVGKEIEGGKESASLEDIKAGTMVTITLNGKGEATYVLITSSGFGGMGGGNFGGGQMPNFGGGNFPNFGGGNRPGSNQETTPAT